MQLDLDLQIKRDSWLQESVLQGILLPINKKNYDPHLLSTMLVRELDNPQPSSKHTLGIKLWTTRDNDGGLVTEGIFLIIIPRVSRKLPSSEQKQRLTASLFLF